MATFFNQATMIYRGQVINSNTTTGEILDVLSANITALSQDYGTQDAVAYAINLVNSGTEALTGVTLNDTLGGYQVGANTVYPLEYIDGTLKLFINGVQQTAPTVTAGPPLAITGINIPAGANALLVYEARTNEFAPQATGSTITSSLSGTGGGACGGVIASDATVAVRDESVPSITKFASPDTVVCNGELTYTFVIQNQGNREIVTTDNLIIEDTFNPILTLTAVEFDGNTWAEGTNYTYNAQTGEFAIVAGQITVPAASYETDPVTGVITTTPGVVTLTVRGNV